MTSTESTSQESSSLTRSVLHRFAHRWVIDEFSHFNSSTTSSSSSETHSIKSTTFSPSANKALKFFVELYPNGRGTENKDNLSVYLNLKDAPDDQPVPVRFEFSIIDGKGGKNKIQETKYSFTKGGTGFGFVKFVPCSELSAQGWLPDDRLTIYCEVNVLSPSFAANSTKNEITLAELEAKAEQKILDSLGALLESGNLSDVVLVVDNGKKEFKAHKIILSSRSRVFDAMFEHDTKEKQESRVDIFDVSVEAFGEFLRYLYTGDCKLMDDNAQELLVIADKYQVDLLKQMCGRALCAKICNATAAELLLFADRHIVSELKKSCIDYITDHATQVMVTEGWKVLAKTEPQLMVEMFRDLAIKNHPKDDTNNTLENLR